MTIIHNAPQAPSLPRPIWEARRLSSGIIAWSLGVYLALLLVLGYVTFQLLIGNL